ETSASLAAELAILGGQLMLTALEGVAEGRLAATPQPEQGITYAPKIARKEGRLDWREPSPDLERRGGAGCCLARGAVSVVRGSGGGGSGCGGAGGRHRGDFARRSFGGGLRRRRTAPPSVTAARPHRARRSGLPARVSHPTRDEAAMPRYKLTIEYDGSGLVGW